jgi:hypothetical protein
MNVSKGCEGDVNDAVPSFACNDRGESLETSVGLSGNSAEIRAAYLLSIGKMSRVLPRVEFTAITFQHLRSHGRILLKRVGSERCVNVWSVNS